MDTTTPLPPMKHGIGITIDWANGGGQERAYGPHVTDATVEIVLPGPNAVGAVYFLEQGYAEQVIKALVSRYCDLGESHNGSMDDHFSPHLVTLERTEFLERERAVWHVRIETPFTD